MLGVLMGPGAERKAEDKPLGLCSPLSPPDGLATQSHLLFSKHHLASSPLCFAKEFIAFFATLTSDILPSLPLPFQMLPSERLFPGPFQVEVVSPPFGLS